MGGSDPPLDPPIHQLGIDSVAAVSYRGPGISIRTHKAGGIHDPSIDQLLQPMLGVMVENRCTTQGVQVAVGIEAEIMGPMVPVGQLLAGIAQGLEVTDGVWVLERGQRWDSSS
jgi:hypothetical protein